MHKLNLQDVAHLLETSISTNAAFCGVSVDSRLHQPGNLFFALAGAQTDGHHYLQEVASKGAVGAVVSDDYQGPHYNLPLIFVKDPLEALQRLGKKILQRSQSRVIAVTGSVGKTTTKDFITTLLKEKYRVACSPGNSNSQIGIPLTILNHTNGQEDIVILEMGMTHPGNIKKLIEMAPPECAVITTVALVHACNFDSLKDIAFAKAEVLEHPKTKVGIIHRDIINYSEISKKGPCTKVSFSTDNPMADYTIDKSTNFEIKFQNDIYKLGSFPLPGKHNQTNFLAAVACARYFGLNWEEIASGMQKLVLPKMRWQFIERDGITFINDAYNASPISVRAALENMPLPTAGGRKIAVLADMLELGQFSEESHREIGQYALNFVDRMFCCGQNAVTS